MQRRIRPLENSGLNVNLDPWAQHAELMRRRELVADWEIGMLRYEPVERTSEAVKTKWFTWREHGRLHQVLTASLADVGELVGAGGYVLIEAVLDLLDEEFERLLCDRSAVCIWTCIRHVSPRFWVTADWQIQTQVRRIAEKAVERHGRWDSAGDPLLATWSASDMQAAGRCLATAEAYNNLLAARRRLAKGQSGRVSEWSPFHMSFSDPSGDLGRLIDVRDRRTSADENPLSSLGSVGPKLTHPTATTRPMRVSASFADPQRLQPDAEAHALITEAITSYGVSVAQADVVADWADTPNALDLEKWFSPYDDRLRADLGYTMVDLLAVHSLITVALFPHLNRGVGIPASLEFCGYATCDVTLVDLSRATDAAQELGLSGWKAVTPASATAAFAGLSKDAAETHPRTTGRRAIWQLHGRLLIDFVSFDLEYHLVNHLAAAAYFETTNPFDFEERVHAELTPHGRQPVGPGCKIQIDGNARTDIDASVIVGTTLIAIDCFASPWRDALDEGDHAATRNRMTALVQKLRDWDMKMAGVCTSPPEWIRNAGVTEVLPVVVSATPEWVGDTDPLLWFTPELPRICTVEELVNKVIPDSETWVPFVIAVKPQDSVGP